MSQDTELAEKIICIGKKLEKHSKCCDDRKVLEYLRMLETVEMTLELLKETGIGIVVHTLRKNAKSYSTMAKTLLLKWKKIVADNLENKSKNGTIKRKLSLEDYKQKKIMNGNKPVTEIPKDSDDITVTSEMNVDTSLSEAPNSDECRPVLPDLAIPDLPLLPPPEQTPSVLSLGKKSFPPPPNPVRDPSAMDAHFLPRKSKSAVYHGRRYESTEIPTLFDMSIQVLKENIDELTYVGCIPFHILKPVFEVANASQLECLHYHNPQFADEIEVLWERICKLEFKGLKPDNMESWYDFYMRRKCEEEERLNALRQKLSSKFSSLPKVRTTKLTNFSGLKSQNEANKRMATTKINSPSSYYESSNPSRSSSHLQFQKPSKVAPLMAKTLKMLKQRRN